MRDMGSQHLPVAGIRYLSNEGWVWAEFGCGLGLSAECGSLGW